MIFILVIVLIWMVFQRISLNFITRLFIPFSLLRIPGINFTVKNSHYLWLISLSIIIETWKIIQVIFTVAFGLNPLPIPTASNQLLSSFLTSCSKIFSLLQWIFKSDMNIDSSWIRFCCSPDDLMYRQHISFLAWKCLSIENCQQPFSLYQRYNSS